MLAARSHRLCAHAFRALPSVPVHWSPAAVHASSGWSIEAPSGPRRSQVDQTIEVLLESYPKLFSETPDLSIYRDDIEFRGLAGLINVVKPDTIASGDAGPILGLDGYRRLFDALRLARHTTVDTADLSFKLSRSECDRTLRVRWHAKLWLRLFGPAEPLCIDGVSVYELDDEARVRIHRLENVERYGDRPHTPVVDWSFGLGLAAPPQPVFALAPAPPP